MKRLLIICLLAAILPVSPSFARSPKTTKPKPIEHHDTVIASVSADSITINEDKVSKVFKISQFTEITLRGQKTTVAELKPGMAVSVTIGSDPMTATRIVAGDVLIKNEPPRSGYGKGK